MLLADKVLFVAGRPGKVLGQEAKNSAAVLLAVSAQDGSVLAQCPLDGPPLGDGMALAKLVAYHFMPSLPVARPGSAHEKRPPRLWRPFRACGTWEGASS